MVGSSGGGRGLTVVVLSGTVFMIGLVVEEVLTISVNFYIFAVFNLLATNIEYSSGLNDVAEVVFPCCRGLDRLVTLR